MLLDFFICRISPHLAQSNFKPAGLNWRSVQNATNPSIRWSTLKIVNGQIHTWWGSKKSAIRDGGLPSWCLTSGDRLRNWRRTIVRSAFFCCLIASSAVLGVIPLVAIVLTSLQPSPCMPRPAPRTQFSASILLCLQYYNLLPLRPSFPLSNSYSESKKPSPAI